MSLKYQTEEDNEINQDRGAMPIVREPLPYYTIAFIFAIGIVFLVQITHNLNDSVKAAGFVKPAFLQQHEYWRILTGATLHGGPLHVVLNCFAFYSFGRVFETLSNRAHLAIVFVLSAIGGGVLSLIFKPDETSVGASGGIVGIIGYLLIYAFRRRQFVSSGFRQNLIFNIGFMLVYGYLLRDIIDNFGHIGGLLAGAVYGVIQIPSDAYTDPREAGKAAGTAGIAAMGIYFAACVFSILLILGIV